jgi:IS30 family transposase
MNTDYRHLNVDERAFIQLALERSYTLRAIARSVQRAPSTISRELARNAWIRPPKCRGRGRPRLAGGYRAVQAQERAVLLTQTPRVSRRLAPGNGLWEQVVRLLRRRHSPEQISGILRRMHPGEPQRNASHETIYTALYAMPRGELRSELISCLRQARRRRLPRARGEDRRGKITNMVSIHMRPPEIEERVIPGHWEGDLIKGIRGKSVVGTLVERSTLFVTLAKIRDATADAAVTGFSHVLKRIDAQRRLSLTYDQGREMAAHQRLTKITGVKVYFADPHSPWQRGINENTNGLLRQYLPKNADLSVLKQSELDAIAWQLNTRPRKSLGWKCPAELFIPNSFDYAAYYKAIVALPT